MTIEDWSVVSANINFNAYYLHYDYNKVTGRTDYCVSKETFLKSCATSEEARIITYSN